MRILYCGCHSILEYDDITLFRDLGHYVFSPGAYVEPANPGDASLRPGLFDIQYDPEDVAGWHRLGKPGIDNKELITKEYADRFDVIIFVHIPKWIKANWENVKHKNVILRTIGQNWRGNEMEILPYRRQGLKIVRYSPAERRIPGYIGEDAMIRFYKDPKEFKDWTGEEKYVISLCQSMKRRGAPCNYDLFVEATSPFPRKLFGPESEMDTFGQGKVSFDDMKNALRKHRVYFYTGTWPASTTLNFIESMMTGIPIVAIGPRYGHPHGWFPDHDLYEAHEIIENGRHGFWSDNVGQLQNYIHQLLTNDALAAQISAAGRQRAIELFGKETIKNQWKVFLESLS